MTGAVTNSHLRKFRSTHFKQICKIYRICLFFFRKGFATTNDEYDADVIFLNTCAIRDNAEQRIRERLKHLRNNKKKNGDLIIGVLGCMAERLKDKLLEEEKLVDVVAGPDSYRDLPKLV